MTRNCDEKYMWGKIVTKQISEHCYENFLALLIDEKIGGLTELGTDSVSDEQRLCLASASWSDIYYHTLGNLMSEDRRTQIIKVTGQQIFCSFYPIIVF